MSAAAWQARLLSIAGPGLADPAKEAGLFLTMNRLADCERMGADLEADAVPVVMRMTAHQRVKPIRTWALFVEDIMAHKKKREAKNERRNTTDAAWGSVLGDVEDDGRVRSAQPVTLGR